MKSKKVILSCAITGSIHTPTMSPYLPITPEDIARESIAAAQAGAAILHLHARDPVDGRPSFDPQVFRQFLPQIHAQCDAIINISTGGSIAMTLEQRIAAALDVSPEMASCNMGSMNFGFFPIAEKFKEWKHDWEKQHLLSSRNAIFRNTFGDIEQLFERLAIPGGTRFEFECYDVGHIYTLKHFVDRGYVKNPFIQFVLGILGGIGADSENLVYMKHVADKLFGENYQWSVLGAGRNQMPMVTQAAIMGGNVRVGLEDSLSLGNGQVATSNAQQVEQVKTMLAGLGLELATPAEAREMLGLKGKDKLNMPAA